MLEGIVLPPTKLGLRCKLIVSTLPYMFLLIYLFVCLLQVYITEWGKILLQGNISPAHRCSHCYALPSASCSRASAHKDSPREPTGFKGADLWCRTASRMPCREAASTPCSAVTPQSQLSPCSRERCCCRSINILGLACRMHWRCKAVGMAVLEEAEGVTKPASHLQCWTAADPMAATSTCTQTGFIKDVKETQFTLSSIPEKQSCVHSLQKPWSAQKMFVLPLTRTHETWLWFALEIVKAVSIWVDTS